MIKNSMSFELGGQERRLLFDLGALDNISEITGADAFEFNVRFDTQKAMLEDVLTVVYAGLLSNSESKNENPEYSREDVKKWVRRLTIPQIREIIVAFQGAFKMDASQEGGGDTQP